MDPFNGRTPVICLRIEYFRMRPASIAFVLICVLRPIGLRS